jgi:hypothetical protein
VVAEVEARALEPARQPVPRGAVPAERHSPAPEEERPVPALALEPPEQFRRRVVAQRLVRVAARRTPDRLHSPTAGRRPRSRVRPHTTLQFVSSSAQSFHREVVPEAQSTPMPHLKDAAALCELDALS